MMNSFAISSLISSRSALPIFSALRGAAGVRSRPLPKRLRQALEHLSGYDLRDVRVHYGSMLPARLGARAFALGRDIYLRAGATDTLSHEAWHVVQQKQGRVRATRSLHAALAAQAIGLNDQEALEREADVMGERAAHLARSGAPLPCPLRLRSAAACPAVLQRSTQVKGVAYPPLKLQDFQTAIKTNLPNDLLTLEEFANITKDILNEDLIFASWPDLAREIYIRDVGYRVEAKMRSFMTAHQANMKEIIAEKKAQEEKINKQWAAIGESLNKATTSEEVDEICNRMDAIDKQLAELQTSINTKVTKSVIFWGEGVPVGKPVAEFHSSPMANWLSGESNLLPYRMNCWETVLFAAYSAGVVSRDYIAWCDGRYPKEPTLVPACYNILDDYYTDLSSPNPAPYTKRAAGHVGPPGWDAGKDNTDPANKKLKDQFGESSWVIPERKVIPRGRIMIYYNGSHVAISTGQDYPIVVPTGKPLPWKNGHGILEIDGDHNSASDEDYTLKRLIEEKAMEDLLNTDYHKLLVIAPFPICDKTDQSVITLPDPNALIDEESIAKDINAGLDKKYNDKVNRLKEQLKKQNEALNSIAVSDEKRQKVINDSIKRNQSSLDKLLKERNDTFDGQFRLALSKAKTQAVIKKTYKWQKFDPYNNKVEAPVLEYNAKKYAALQKPDNQQ